MQNEEWPLAGLAVTGAIGMLPMVKMKLGRYSIAPAVVFYLPLPFFIFSLTLFATSGRAKGGIVALRLALPLVLVVAT